MKTAVWQNFTSVNTIKYTNKIDKQETTETSF